MESSRRDILKYMAELKSFLKNSQDKNLIFTPGNNSALKQKCLFLLRWILIFLLR